MRRIRGIRQAGGAANYPASNSLTVLFLPSNEVDQLTSATPCSDESWRDPGSAGCGVKTAIRKDPVRDPTREPDKYIRIAVINGG
jgi:hypothetical protein